MSMTRTDTTVYGRDRLLTRLPRLKRPWWRSRRKTVQVPETAIRVETPSLSDYVGRICEGSVLHLGVRYNVTLWRGPEGEVVTIATAPNYDGRRRLVTHKATIELLKIALLSDAVYDEVHEELQRRRIDVDDETLDGLVRDAMESVEDDDCNVQEAVRLQVGALVRERRGY